MVPRMPSICRLIRNAALAVGFRVIHQMPGEQLLIEGAGHLGDEDAIAVILIRLVFCREIRVHGMSGFVCQCEDVIQHVRLIVHQNERLAVESSAAEGSAAFTLVRIAIRPAGYRETISQDARVLRSKWSQ